MFEHTAGSVPWLLTTQLWTTGDVWIGYPALLRATTQWQTRTACTRTHLEYLVPCLRSVFTPHQPLCFHLALARVLFCFGESCFFLFFLINSRKKDSCNNLKSDRGAFRTCGFSSKPWLCARLFGDFRLIVYHIRSYSLSGLSSANSAIRQARVAKFRRLIILEAVTPPLVSRCLCYISLSPFTPVRLFLRYILRMNHVSATRSKVFGLHRYRNSGDSCCNTEKV